ncbi:MAG TPA: Isoquinoline 1-oxidoreductase subunit [Myxococcales bacterium]|jgi:hypothetical protein|nr:Isoquinoline 1-oxidoreductase subunit [Myxococcales bacterium]
MRALFVLAAFAVACSHADTAPQAAKADPIAAFETVKTVLQSPRCVNCHPTGDQPTQGDDAHLHPQFVTRGPEGKGATGLACTTCHSVANPPASYGAHMPPGVSTGWKLPPPEHKMVFAGMSSSALCEQLKDEKKNGGKDMAALFKHVSSDPLVMWGWSPGYGRAPVAIAHPEFVRAFKTWMDAGAPCTPARTASLP